MASLGNLFLGTSGWSYREWIGPFYTKEDKSMLRAYARVFRTAEIDSTFYRYPSKGMAMGWSRYTPEDFVFTAKLPKIITHEKKLDMKQEIDKDTERFLELMQPLTMSGKLGCVLIQLPPRFKYDPATLEAYFRALPSHVRFAVEFRHPSWMRQETWNLLERHNVAYTIVDEPLLPPEVHVTTDFAYFRLHGRGTAPWFDYRYSPEELEPWVPKIKESLGQVKKTYGYFNNHFHGYAVENCLQILEMFGKLTPEQAKARERVEAFRKSAGDKNIKLEAFFKPEEESFEQLLLSFLDRDRLKRTQEIADSELNIETSTENEIIAQVRNYRVNIDVEAKTIMHDCADWGKGISSKRFCKHVGRLFLALDKELAEKMLREMRDHKNKWRFQTFQ
jgi:uncharacterized protein YecE (DUF72 family)